MRITAGVLLCTTLFVLLSLPSPGQPLITSDSIAAAKPDRSVTRHSVKIEGHPINYTATAGTLLLKNEKEEPIALFGFTAYFKDGEPAADKRPLTFAFNGGPGSSSIWLHIGALGPRHIIVADPSPNPPAPYKLEDNEYSILDVTDLVMIDPIGTGLSHAIGKAVDKDFWGIDPDIRSISGFIAQFVKETDRWNSPKFLLGESYGTTRSAGIASYLNDFLGLQLNGIVLVSSVLDLHTINFQDDISYELYLPTYTAVAWYHHKLSGKITDLTSFLTEVRNFAAGDYASALRKGSTLKEEEKTALAARLSACTGLSAAYWLRSNLRVPQSAFSQELLREDHQTIGRLDARYKGITQNLLSEYSNDDPQSTQISPPFIASYMNYFYTELKVDKKYTYHVNAYNTEGFKWDWRHAANGDGFPTIANTGVDLASAMSKNPHLKVLVLNGYYDLATPFFATEYTFDHLGLEKNIRDNITLKYYEAGHMMYIHPASLAAFKKDIATFIRSVP